MKERTTTGRIEVWEAAESSLVPAESDAVETYDGARGTDRVGLDASPDPRGRPSEHIRGPRGKRTPHLRTHGNPIKVIGYVRNAFAPSRDVAGSCRHRRRGHTFMRGIPEGLIPDNIAGGYEIHNWRNAAQVLVGSYPAEWEDILDVLGRFSLRKSDVVAAGGGKSKISNAIDAAFTKRGWKERQVSYKMSIDDDVRESSTHKIDCYRNRVGLEIEWNSKDQTYIRDLNTFRILFDMQILDVGIIVTRADHLQEIFESIGSNIGAKYGPSTTHMSKLLPRIAAGGGGGCPVLVFGITRNLYAPNS